MTRKKARRTQSRALVHDGLFKHMFTSTVNAAAELRAVLPHKISKPVNWDTLSLVHANVVRRGFSQRYGDLLYEAKLHAGQGMYVWLMFEHQSSMDWLLPLRIQDNATGLWTRHIRKHPRARRLPAILSVVLYHGRRPWNAPTSIIELLDLPEEVRAAWEPYVPSCRFLLDDLETQDNEALAARDLPAYPKVGLAVMKYGRAPNVGQKLAFHADAIQVLRRDDIGRESWEFLLGYLYRINPHLTDEEIATRLSPALDPEDENTMLTLRESLKEFYRESALREGRREGRREGLQQGQREALQRTLQAQIRKRFGRLPRPAAARIRAADIPALSAWLERILDAETVDDIFVGHDEA